MGRFVVILDTWEDVKRDTVTKFIPDEMPRRCKEVEYSSFDEACRQNPGKMVMSPEKFEEMKRKISAKNSKAMTVTRKRSAMCKEMALCGSFLKRLWLRIRLIFTR